MGDQSLAQIAGLADVEAVFFGRIKNIDVEHRTKKIPPVAGFEWSISEFRKLSE